MRENVCATKNRFAKAAIATLAVVMTSSLISPTVTTASSNARTASGRNCSNPSGFSHFGFSRLVVRGPVTCSRAGEVIRAPIQDAMYLIRGWRTQCRQVGTKPIYDGARLATISDCRSWKGVAWFTYHEVSF